MATTTSNFGWPIPQSTDLVKDGATAIASLGSGVDTSMVDLKGGTTGQILSKTSNTDMDFTWITPNPGDITGVTAGTGLTGGGTSGSVTLDFDVANYGGGQYAAGKNKIINGDFGIWQRGTSFSSSGYTADRWVLGTDATCTVSQQTFTPASAPVSGYEGQFYLQTAKSAGGSYAEILQRIEDVRTFAGQTITISYWARVSSGTATNELYASQNFGSGGSTTTGGALSPTHTLTTSWQRFSISYAVPSVSGKTIGTGSYLALSILRLVTGSAVTADIWGVQVEAGSTASIFQTATGTKQGELAACQRYYWYFTNAETNRFVGQAITTSSVQATIFYPVTLRANPTITYATASGYQAFKADGTGYAAGGISTVAANVYSLTFNLTSVSTSPLVAGNASMVQPSSNRTEISAEL